MLQNKKIAIILNGLFPSHRDHLKNIAAYNTVIACDGAYTNACDAGIKPDYTIGDFDSVNKDQISHGEAIQISRQSDNDMSKAMEWVSQNNGNSVDIYGGGGLRDDHYLSNISILLEHFPNLSKRFFTDFGVFTSQRQEHKYKSYKGQQVSIFGSDKTIIVSAKGLRYSVNNLTLDPGYRLSLNESLGSQFSVTNSHGTILIYQAYDLK